MDDQENPADENLWPPDRSRNPFLVPLTADRLAQIHANRAAKVAEWAKLPLRQTWADETWMRGFLSEAGLRFGSSLEPATVPRLRRMLRRAKLMTDQCETGVGCSLDRYLELNPLMPLWAATALVIEACRS